jgi:hypothetical protein
MSFWVGGLGGLHDIDFAAFCQVDTVDLARGGVFADFRPRVHRFGFRNSLGNLLRTSQRYLVTPWPRFRSCRHKEALDFSKPWFCDGWRLHSSDDLVEVFEPAVVDLFFLSPLGKFQIWEPRLRQGRRDGGDDGGAAPAPLAVFDRARGPWDGPCSGTESDGGDENVPIEGEPNDVLEDEVVESDGAGCDSWETCGREQF